MKKLYSALWVIDKVFHYCFINVFIFALIVVTNSLISIFMNVINKNMVNELESSINLGKLSDRFIIFVVTYMILYFLFMAFGFFYTFGHNLARCKVDLLFDKLFMYKSIKTPQEKFFDNEFMDKYHFVSNNTAKISQFIHYIIRLVFSNFTVIIGAVVLFVMYEKWLILYTCAVATIYSIVTYFISNKQYELSKKQIKEQRYHDYYKGILTNKENAKELRIYKLGEFIFEKWNKSYLKLKNQRLNLNLKKTNLMNASKIITFILRCVAIFILLLGIYNNKYSLGVFVMLFGLTESCNKSIYRIVNNIFSGAYNELNYIVDYVDFVKPVTKKDFQNIRKMSISSDTLEYGDFKELSLKNVTFKYPNGEKNAVDDVSLNIKKGEIISILGYNGSGKTTLSKLLSGMILPKDGCIKLNNVEITEKNKTEMFKYFGIAFQEYSKYSISLNDNIAIGRIERFNDKEEIDNSIKKANLQDFIKKYKKGRDTILGKEYDDYGVDLSGGEWQKIVIARAYMGEPQILILDEPTASIDPLKEMEMIENLRTILNGKTAILISHRIGFARLADKIVMMDKGKIIEQGTHEQLLEKDNYYAKLFKEQKKLYEEVAVTNETK